MSYNTLEVEMATIKDISKATGLSHTTVSNVINKKGNVSYEKISLVEKVARELGYSQNLKAKLLRNSNSTQVAVILPSLEIPEYLAFFISVKNYLESKNYELQLFLTDDMPIKERDAIQRIAGFEMAGTISIPTLDRENMETIPEGMPWISVERKSILNKSFIGFDYERIAEDLGSYIDRNGYNNIVLLSGENAFSNNSELLMLLRSICPSRRISNVTTITSNLSGTVFSMVYDNPNTDLIIATSEIFVDAVKEANLFCSDADLPQIVCLSSTEKCDDKVCYYILDYRKLGRTAAEQLVSQIESKAPNRQTVTVSPTGFSGKYSSISFPRTDVTLNVLFQETPSSSIIMKIGSYFTKQTGIRIRFNTFAFPDQYNAIRSMEPEGLFDVMRLDMSWLDNLRESYLMELSNLDSVRDYIASFPDYMVNEFVQPSKGIFAIPSEPSVQMFFYRKDLFENPLYIRQFAQLFGKELKVPKTYGELLDISRFFSRSINPTSPTSYGGTTVMVYPSSAVCDFVPRMLEHDHCYDENGLLDFGSEQMLQALRLYNESFSSTSRKKIWWGDAAKGFAMGKNATTTIYTNHAFMMLDTQSASTAGQIGFDTVPGGHPLLGGSSLGVGRHSKHPVEALEFIKWLTSEEMAKTIIKTGGMSPRVSIYSDTWLLEKYPWISTIEENYKKGVSRDRIFYKGDRQFRLTDFENNFGVALQSMLDNTMSPEEVASFMKRMIGNFIQK